MKKEKYRTYVSLKAVKEKPAFILLWPEPEHKVKAGDELIVVLEE